MAPLEMNALDSSSCRLAAEPPVKFTLLNRQSPTLPESGTTSETETSAHAAPLRPEGGLEKGLPAPPRLTNPHLVLFRLFLIVYHITNHMRVMRTVGESREFLDEDFD